MPIYNSSLLFRLPLTPSRSRSLSRFYSLHYLFHLSLSSSAKPLINCHWLKRQKQSALLMLWLRLLQRVGNTFFGVVVIVANSLLIICRIISFFFLSVGDQLFITFSLKCHQGGTDTKTDWRGVSAVDMTHSLCKMLQQITFR